MASSPANIFADVLRHDLAAFTHRSFLELNGQTPFLTGWHPEVLAAQRIAGDRTPRSEDYAAGRAPVLYLQPDHDPLAHAEDAETYKKALGDRVTVVTIPHCSHAAVAEQPGPISDALIAFAHGLADKPK